MSNRFPERFEPATLSLDWSSVTPAKAPVSTAVNPEIRDDWTPVRNRTDPNVLQAYIRDHPANDPHIPEAAIRLDDAIWMRTNQGDIHSVRDYLIRFLMGTHWMEARDIVERLTRATPQVSPSPANLPAQPPADSSISAQDRQGIKAALQRFNRAFEDKSQRELKGVWPGASKDWLESMNQKGAYFTASLYATGQPEVKEDRAVLQADLITTTIRIRTPARPTF